MRRLTKKMKAKFEEGKRFRGNWDAGAMFMLSIDWDTEKYIISSNEILKDLKKYLSKWSGIKKFKIKGSPRISIEYVR